MHCSRSCSPIQGCRSGCSTRTLRCPGGQRFMQYAASAACDGLINVKRGAGSEQHALITITNLERCTMKGSGTKTDRLDRHVSLPQHWGVLCSSTRNTRPPLTCSMNTSRSVGALRGLSINHPSAPQHPLQTSTPAPSSFPSPGEESRRPRGVAAGANALAAVGLPTLPNTGETPPE